MNTNNKTIKPSGQQIFEAFTKMVEFQDFDHPEVEKTMLSVLNKDKKGGGVDYLDRTMNDTIWKKISRLFLL